MIVRTLTDPLRLARPIAAAVHELDARQPISELQPFQQAIDESLAPVRVIGLLLLICGGIAVWLAAIGIFGVLTNWVALRTRELGLRLALGANSYDLVRLVLKEAGQMALVGIGVGVPLSAARARGGEQALFGLSSPTVLAVVLASRLR